MSFPIETYRAQIDDFYGLMLKSVELADVRLPDGEWTLCDMVAHLIDSFSNNHQRIVRLQLQDQLDFPGYDAETWRSVSNIDGLDFRFLADLWRANNLYLIAVISGIDDLSLDHVWVSPDGSKTLRFIVEDYFRHIHWHVDFFESRVSALRSALS